MNTVRFNIREIPCHGGQGLSCEGLHLDQLHIWFVPNTAPSLVGKFEGSDDNTKTWRAETKIVNVCVTPGERYTLLTRPKTATESDSATVHRPDINQIYSVSLHDTAYTGGGDEDFWCRSYAPTRDSPVARNLLCVGEIQLDLRWPLLQGDPTAAASYVPEYRLERVLAEFSYH